jgi:hypothetical protein
VALAWTCAIVFALLALIVAKWLGTSAGYNALVKKALGTSTCFNLRGRGSL